MEFELNLFCIFDFDLVFFGFVVKGEAQMQIVAVNTRNIIRCKLTNYHFCHSVGCRYYLDYRFSTRFIYNSIYF